MVSSQLNKFYGSNGHLFRPYPPKSSFLAIFWSFQAILTIIQIRKCNFYYRYALFSSEAIFYYRKYGVWDFPFRFIALFLKIQYFLSRKWRFGSLITQQIVVMWLQFFLKVVYLDDVQRLGPQVQILDYFFIEMCILDGKVCLSRLQKVD